jgi:hypothetical protein
MNDRQFEESIDVQPLTANSHGGHRSVTRVTDEMRCVARLGDIPEGTARPCLGFVGNVSVWCTVPVYLQQKRPQHVYNQDAYYESRAGTVGHPALCVGHSREDRKGSGDRRRPLSWNSSDLDLEV